MQWQAGMGSGKNRGDPTKRRTNAFYLQGSVDGATKFFNIELSKEWFAVANLAHEMRARPGIRAQSTLVASKGFSVRSLAGTTSGALVGHWWRLLEGELLLGRRGEQVPRHTIANASRQLT